MKTEIIEDSKSDELHNKIINTLNDKTMLIVHVSTFYDQTTEKHKAIICYYE